MNGTKKSVSVMDYSRRDLSMILAVLAAGTASAQKKVLPSTAWRYEDLPVRTNGANKQRAVFNGATHTGFGIELHETELAPGEMPHPAHHHVHEEMIIIREGAMAVTISGKTSELGPGSVALVASNEEHGWRNVGKTRARYMVMALGRES
jgi:quercetin dioxygenase-like cupin family protein